MTSIESYLSGALPYTELTDAERNAICAAKEGRVFSDDFVGWSHPRYTEDGTAALRLVERFGLNLECYPSGWQAFQGLQSMRGFFDRSMHRTPAIAIVACVCEIAKDEWPYKGTE